MKSLTVSAVLALGLAAAGVVGLVRVAADGAFSLSAGAVSLGVTSFDVGVRIDALSATLLVFVAVLGFLIATYSRRNLRGQRRVERFGWLLSASYVSLALLVCGASLPIIAVGWTASGLLLTGLIAHRGTPSALRAASSVRARLLVGDGLLWAAVILAALALPSLNRAGLEDSVGAVTAAPLVLITLLLVGACVVRSALVPAWSWLPQTAEAPSPVSAYLHAGIVNGAGVLVALLWPLFRSAPTALAALLLIGALSAVIGTVAARTRPDVKGQLASSTTSQMGYMCVQLGLGLPAVAVLHVIGHGFYKAWLFLRAGGEVTRRRDTPVPVASPTPRSSALAVGLALVVPLAVLVILTPISASMVAAFGLVGLVPACAAAATTAAGIHGVLAVRRGARGKAATLVIGSGVALAGYIVAVSGWEWLLSSTLPAVAVWSLPASAAWLLLLALATIGAVLLARRVAARPDSAVALRLLATALPPGARTLPASSPARLPQVENPSAEDASSTRATVDAACRVTAPAFPLRAFVAANPLAGLETVNFDLAADIATTWSARTYLTLAEYHTLYDSGRITESDLELAATSPGAAPTRHDATHAPVRSTALAEMTLCERSSLRVATPRGGWTLSDIAMAHAGLFTAHVWGTLPLAPGAADDDRIYRRWRQACISQRWGALMGVPGADELAPRLSEDPAEALTSLLQALPEGVQPFAYLCRLLSAAPGWAGHGSWRVREGQTDALIELLAVRAAIDLAVSLAAPPATEVALDPPTSGSATELGSLAIWQRALEFGYQNRLVASLTDRARQPRVSPSRAAEPAAQLVFCIDVRSERFRRHLEPTGSYETYGFAGFFGATVRYQAPSGQQFDQYPVLLPASCSIRSAGSLPTARYAYSAGAAAAKQPLTAFALAEGAGILTGIAGLTQTLAPRLYSRAVQLLDPTSSPENLPPLAPAHGEQPTGAELPVGMTLEDQTQLAENALRAIGLTERFATLIVITAHGSTVQNNAFAAGYDCGACGGNAGLVNARMLAAALNSPQVRARLAARGIVIPEHCRAVAALHNTTTDHVTLEDSHLEGQAAATAQVLRADLRLASMASATERCADLPGAPRVEDSSALRHAAARAHDWSEPVPEWGLAGNAAFVAGPRWLTRSINLGGRVFLHSYDPDNDPELAVLHTIVNAPVVVAQWINAQYYFSSVDPGAFGSGDKSTHNVVGDVGVITGACGDLRTGLPWQTLFTAEVQIGTDVGRHEPLRLSVVLYSSPSNVSSVLDASPHVRALVGNQWIHVIAVDPETGMPWALQSDLTWTPWDLASTNASAGVAAHSG